MELNVQNNNMLKVKQNLSEKKSLEIFKLRKMYFFFNSLSLEQRLYYQNFLVKKASELQNKYKDICDTSQFLVNYKKKIIKEEHITEKKKKNKIIIEKTVKRVHKNLLDTYNLNLELSNIHYFQNRSNNLFLDKFSNLLMKNGEKRSSHKIVLKFLEILHSEFQIMDTVKILRKFIFVNLVPAIRPKTIGFNNKKVVGIPISIYKRIGMSFKLFIKGARSHKVPIVYGLLLEFFKFYSKDTLLQQTNIKTLNDIKVHSLFKYVQIDKNFITPEKYYMETFQNKSKYTFKDLLKIDWKNFDNIILYIKEYNHKKIFLRQFEIITTLKNHLLKKLKLKGDAVEVEKTFPEKNPIRIIDKNMYNIKKVKFYKVKKQINKSSILNSYIKYSIYSKLSDIDFENSRKYLQDLNVTTCIGRNFSKKTFISLQNLVVKDNIDIELLVYLDSLKKKSQLNFKDIQTWFLQNKIEKKEEPIYKYVVNHYKYIQKDNKNLKKNIFINYMLSLYNAKKLFLMFKDEIEKRVINTSLTRIEIKYLYYYSNLKNLDLNLKVENFKDIPSIKKIFGKYKVWNLEKLENFAEIKQTPKDLLSKHVPV